MLSIITGLLIGLELPLAVRLNERFEELKVNISSVLEKDYYGSLLGGLFFAFLGLPHLGLTYTPFILGSINLIVAFLLLNIFPIPKIKRKKLLLNVSGAIIAVIIFGGAVSAEKIILFGEQKKYKDKIVYYEQTKYQKIVITEWKNNYWLYLNNNLQFSSFDEPLYHEVLVHPAMELASDRQNVLILGGGDGCAAREVLKHPEVRSITLVDIDQGMTDLAREHPALLEINKGALNNEKVEIINADGYTFMEQNRDLFDVIIIDLPDPRSVEMARLYSLEFYLLCYQHLHPKGAIITQAGSPYYAARSFACIKKTLEAARFSTLPMHNQILTMGEWGWVLGKKIPLERETAIARLQNVNYDNLPTQWLNKEAVCYIASFGKSYFDKNEEPVKINKIFNPVLYRYFLEGSWDVY
jgi:spermidine synthase